jgi:hypothetical protein
LYPTISQSDYVNRSKQSVVLDLGKADDKLLLEAMLAKANVFVQNLKPGALAKLGFPISRPAHATSTARLLLDFRLMSFLGH